MKAPEEIGTPLSLQIWHDNSGGNAAGWYLGKVVVVDLQQKRWYVEPMWIWSAAEFHHARNSSA